MWLLEVIFIACLAARVRATAGEAKLPVEQVFVPRYTLESNRQDLTASQQNQEQQQQQRPPAVAGDKKPWRRRVDYGYDGVSTAAWSAASSPAAILSNLNPLLAPGMLLLGVNLGALLYMLLGLLGLAPHRSNSRVHLPSTISQAWPTNEILYRQNLDDGGKETAVYF